MTCKVLGMIWRLFVFFLLILFSCEASKYGHFFKTTVRQNTCDLSHKLTSQVKKSRIACAEFCTSEPECTRYLYCSETLICELYLDGTDCIVQGNTTGCLCAKRNIACDGGTCICPFGYYGSSCENILIDCKEGAIRGMSFPNAAVLVTVHPTTAPASFEIRCYIAANGWSTVFTRNNACVFENFNRSLVEYEAGFGTVENGFIGLKNLKHLLNNAASSTNLDIRLSMEDGSFCGVFYSNFDIIGGNYALSLGGFAGTTPLALCTDSLIGSMSLNGNSFSTYDADFTGSNQCATRFGGGWWFESNIQCTRNFLTGTMDGSGTDIFWMDRSTGSTIVEATITLLRLN